MPITPEDVEPYLGGVSTPAEAFIQDAIDSAVAQLEELTGRYPFEADEEASELSLDPPDGSSGRLVLDLPGFVSIESVESDGETCIYYEPPGIPGKPIDAIEFAHWVSHKRFSVVVNGVGGSYATLPADVKTALCKLAAANIIETGIGSNGAIRKEDLGDRSVEYATPSGQGSVSTLSDSYRKDFDRVVSRYKRIPRNP